MHRRSFGIIMLLLALWSRGLRRLRVPQSLPDGPHPLHQNVQRDVKVEPMKNSSPEPSPAYSGRTREIIVNRREAIIFCVHDQVTKIGGQVLGQDRLSKPRCGQCNRSRRAHVRAAAAFLCWIDGWRTGAAKGRVRRGFKNECRNHASSGQIMASVCRSDRGRFPASHRPGLDVSQNPVCS